MAFLHHLQTLSADDWLSVAFMSLYTVTIGSVLWWRFKNGPTEDEDERFPGDW